MKTREVIEALAADRIAGRSNPYRVIANATLAGAWVSLAILLFFVGVRPDAAAALESWRFPAKLAFAFALPVVSAVIVFDWSRPDARPRKARLIAVPLLLLAAGIAVELASVRPAAWITQLVGAHPVACFVLIVVFALGPLAGLLWSLRRTAPASPARCGAAAGLLAGAIGALLYALHCTDDSPLFVAAWYILGLVAMAIVGAVAGRRLLRW